VRNKRWLGAGLLALVVLLAINELRPVGAVAATPATASVVAGGEAAVPVPWPADAQAALGVEDEGVVAATSGARPQPIASVAKVMTALLVLKARPLATGQQGPVITVTADDVAEYHQEDADGESVVPVQAGEQLTEYQALQGLLIPSGNNIAGLLARWAVGSVDAMVQRMNQAARAMGLLHTRFADASGFSAQTVSVPADLVRLGEAAMNDPLIASLVAMEEATLPVMGTRPNVNYALGQDGILGIKTGNIPQGGAIYLFAANGRLPDGRTRLLVGAVQGLPTLDLAFSGAKALLDAARTSLQVRHVVSRNQTVGRYALPWGGGSDVVAGQDLDVVVWPGTVIRVALLADPVQPPVAPGTTLGHLHITAGDSSWDVPVANVDGLAAPGRLARLTRITW